MIHDFLVMFKFYRRRLGGFWVHSEVMGWQQRQDWVAKLDLDLCKTNPELYDNGKDIEDYRAKAGRK